MQRMWRLIAPRFAVHYLAGHVDGADGFHGSFGLRTGYVHSYSQCDKGVAKKHGGNGRPAGRLSGFLSAAYVLLADMRISTASIEDCEAIAQLHVASWQRAYAGIVPADYLASLSVERREASWRKVLGEGRSELLVARTEDSIGGFTSFGPSRDGDAPPKCGEIWAIYVSPAAWSQGTGTRLWLAARQRLLELGFETISLWVIAGNERAIRFYLANGFTIDQSSGKEFELGGKVLREMRLLCHVSANPALQRTASPHK